MKAAAIDRMCCAIPLTGFAYENLLEEASMDILLYVDVSSEFCCKMVFFMVITVHQ